jgi:hypothetical protein
MGLFDALTKHPPKLILFSPALNAAFIKLFFCCSIHPNRLHKGVYMSPKRKLSRSRQDYPENILYPDKSKKEREDWKKRNYQGGIFSDSEVGGESQSQQNSWQGPQDKAKSEQP